VDLYSKDLFIAVVLSVYILVFGLNLWLSVKLNKFQGLLFVSIEFTSV